MAKVMITESYLEDIADAIREKKGGSNTYTPGEMAAAISSIDGGSTPTGNIDITQAGVTDVTNYATATVPSASIYGGYDASVTPSITVNASGQVEAEVVIVGYTFPFCYGSGWVDTSAETTIRIQGGNTYQLTVGDNLEYGITDGTLPLVGVAKVGQAEI